MVKLTESIVEQATLNWLEGLGYTPLNASEIAPDAPNSYFILEIEDDNQSN